MHPSLSSSSHLRQIRPQYTRVRQVLGVELTKNQAASTLCVALRKVWQCA